MARCRLLIRHSNDSVFHACYIDDFEFYTLEEALEVVHLPLESEDFVLVGFIPGRGSAKPEQTRQVAIQMR